MLKISRHLPIKVTQLVDLALQAGGPDNVSCVVADVFDPAAASAR